MKEVLLFLSHTYARALLLWTGSCALAFAQTQPAVTTVSAADYAKIVAPGSIAASFGANLAASTVSATTLPLPTALGGVQVSITDSANASVLAQLFFVSSGQVNFVIPSTAALGAGTVTISTGNATVTGPVLISNVAPAIFTANASGTGVPAASVLTFDSTGQPVYTPVFQGSAGSFTPQPFPVIGGNAYLVLFATGIELHSANPLIVTVGGTVVPVTFAGSQGQFAGLDQINVGPIPAGLAGTGAADVVVTVDGIPANTVQIGIQ